jgi:peptidoglycan/xylan/chitin deacetylase (PgdA/CDA1 family)
MNYVTFSFDDGYDKSSLKTAAIFESFGLQCEFSVVATAHLMKKGSPEYEKALLSAGSENHPPFDFWNEMQRRGHVVQPHGYNHTNKVWCGLPTAKRLVLDCIAFFKSNLNGFDPSKSIFCFQGNFSNAEIEEFVASHFRAYRTGYNNVFNPLPNKYTKCIYGDGWPNPEDSIPKSLERFFIDFEGLEMWFVYNLHGLDGTGWEPVSSDFLKRTLENLLEHENLKILPMIRVIEAEEKRLSMLRDNSE